MRHMLKKVLFTAVITAAGCCSLSALMPRGSGANTIAKYLVNGVEMEVSARIEKIRPGDFIGRIIYEAEKNGLFVEDGPEARSMAALFAGNVVDFDCVYTERPDGAGTLHMAMEKEEGVSSVAEISIPACADEKKWHDDGLSVFSGSSWILSVELMYSDGYHNFSNLYTTKITDRQAIIAHYKKQFERGGWSFFSERKTDDSYLLMAVKEEKVYLFMVSHIKDGRYLINITG